MSYIVCHGVHPVSEETLRCVDCGWSPATEESAPTLELGALRIDPAQRRITVNGRAIRMTAREMQVLLFLARQPGRVFTRTEIYAAVWGYATGFHGRTRVLDSTICRIRRDHPDLAPYIVTEHSVGYKLAASALAEVAA